MQIDEMCCEIEQTHDETIRKAKCLMPNEDVLFDVAELFKVFGDSTRVRILSSLSTTELCVCDIANLLSMTTSAVSHQLRILRTSKLVKSRRSGKEIYYSLDDDHVAKIISMAIQHLSE